MQASDGLTNGHVDEQAVPPSSHSQPPDTNTVAVQVAAMDGDAMDTTPDVEAELVHANGGPTPLEAAGLATTTQPTVGATAGELNGSDGLPPVAAPVDAVSETASLRETHD